MSKDNRFDLNNRIICGTISSNNSIYVVTGVVEMDSNIKFIDKQILTLKQYRASLRPVSSFLGKQEIIHQKIKRRKKSCQFDN